MAAHQPSVPARPNRDLPPVVIDGHALFEFSLGMNRALKRLENRFEAREVQAVPVARQLWQGPPRQPR